MMIPDVQITLQEDQMCVSHKKILELVSFVIENHVNGLMCPNKNKAAVQEFLNGKVLDFFRGNPPLNCTIPNLFICFSDSQISRRGRFTFENNCHFSFSTPSLFFFDAVVSDDAGEIGQVWAQQVLRARILAHPAFIRSALRPLLSVVMGAEVAERLQPQLEELEIVALMLAHQTTNNVGWLENRPDPLIDEREHMSLVLVKTLEILNSKRVIPASFGPVSFRVFFDAGDFIDKLDFMNLLRVNPNIFDRRIQAPPEPLVGPHGLARAFDKFLLDCCDRFEQRHKQYAKFLLSCGETDRQLCAVFKEKLRLIDLTQLDDSDSEDDDQATN